MESKPLNTEFRINPENFHPCFWALSQENLSSGFTGSDQHFSN